MTRQKLIALILKKQTYKDLKPTINQIAKQNQQSIKNSISAIQEILTKQYNAESRLYALRFLKDSFQMGSKKFIHSTQQHLLPIIVNFVTDSADEASITKYTGSSFTKTTDLSKFKSIMLSFFKLAKQCLVKWAEWVPNSQFKFKSAFLSLQKKSIRFENQFKYFRQQNFTNFQKNCKQNGFPLSVIKSNETDQKRKTTNDKIHSQKDPKNQLIQQKISSSNQEKTLKKFQLGIREFPKSKNKQILQCHQLFKVYDKKLINGSMSLKDIQQMNNKINQKLSEYMSIPDLNQNQMEIQIQAIFQNIKQISKDFQKMKERNQKQQLRDDGSQSKIKTSSMKKTEPINSGRKIEIPKSPTKQTPKSPINIIKNIKAQQVQTSIAIQYKNDKPKKRQIFEDEDSFLSSNIKTSLPSLIDKQVQKQTKKSIPQTQNKKRSQMVQTQKNKNNIIPQRDQKSNKQISSERVTFKQTQKQIKSVKKEKQLPQKKQLQIQQSLTKESKKSGSKQKFDSKLDFSASQQSRVNFTQSQIDSDQNQEQSKLTGDFKKNQTELRLSSIAQQQPEVFGQTSRRNIAKMQQRSSLQKDSMVQKSSIVNVHQNDLRSQEFKLQKSAIQDYEKKIMSLEQKLHMKQSTQKQLENRLNQLQKLKKIQEEELYKIKINNDKIMKQFSTAVNAQQYNSVKKQFTQLKKQNNKMEQQMSQLLTQIQNLKDQHKKNELQAKRNKQNQQTIKSKQNIRLFTSAQNLPKSKLLSDKQQKQSKYLFQMLDTAYIQNNTHLSKINQILDDNNLTLFKKNILGANQLFFNSQQISFICRTSFFKNQELTLKLELSFQLRSSKQTKPLVRIPNVEQIQVWKKNIVGEDSLYHQQIILKLKKFPFKILKMNVQLSQNIHKTILLPFTFFSFLKKSQVQMDQFDSKFQNGKESIIKSKIFNLNQKVLKDFKSLHFYQGFQLASQNRMCFRLDQQGQNKNLFFCEIINLSKLKCMIKIIPQPYTQQTYAKSEELIQNLIFLIG